MGCFIKVTVDLPPGSPDALKIRALTVRKARAEGARDAKKCCDNSAKYAGESLFYYAYLNAWRSAKITAQGMARLAAADVPAADVPAADVPADDAMKYLIIWRGETVDSFDTLNEAREMMSEYNMAFGGGCSIREGRES